MITAQEALDCPECMNHVTEAGWSLVHACASVGIEHGRSTADELDLYLDSFHRQHGGTPS